MKRLQYLKDEEFPDIAGEVPDKKRAAGGAA